MDGHEHEYVVAYRNTFIPTMVTLGFSNPGNTPIEEAKKALPEDIQCPFPELLEK